MRVNGASYKVTKNSLIKIALANSKMENISDHTFLNNALVVAGNYSDTPPSPVTPVWTSKWLMDELVNY